MYIYICVLCMLCTDMYMYVNERQGVGHRITKMMMLSGYVVSFDVEMINRSLPPQSLEEREGGSE